MIPLFRRNQPDPALSPQKAAAWWFTRLQSDKATSHDRARFAAWRDANPEHAHAFARIEAAWKRMELAAGTPTVVAARTASLVEPRLRRQLAAAAAVLLVVGGAGLGALALLQRNPGVSIAELPLILLGKGPDRGTFSTAVGERSTITLADGSVMTLDTDSATSVAYTAEARSITLTRGRALFEVAKNDKQPFIVEAGDRRITAVGTVFDVRLQQAQVQVTLVEGQVIVDESTPVTAPPTTRDAPGRARLQAGERLTAKQGKEVVVAATNLDQATSWRNGRLIIAEQTLGEAIAEINRYTRTPIILGDAKMAGLSISGVFRAGQPAEFAQALMNVYPVSAVTADRSIRIEWKKPTAGEK